MPVNKLKSNKMKAITIKKIETFLKDLKTDIDILSCIDIENIDINSPFDSIYGMLNDSGGFDIEIIYYDNAMEYLSKNDNSLRESLKLANDMSFSLDNLNSETLASLLASENSRADFDELQSEIEEFFESEIVPIEESEEEES
jgi:hypothetical protein